MWALARPKSACTAEDVCLLTCIADHNKQEFTVLGVEHKECLSVWTDLHAVYKLEVSCIFLFCLYTRYQVETACSPASTGYAPYSISTISILGDQSYLAACVAGMMSTPFPSNHNFPVRENPMRWWRVDSESVVKR